MPRQNTDKVIIRLPDGMRNRIRDAAKANLRSMNAEITIQLQRAYAAEQASPSGEQQ